MSDRRTTIRRPHGAPRLAAAVLLAIVCLAPSGAEAAVCGGQVAPSPRSVAHTLLDEGGTAEFLAAPALPKPPCSGPQCSEGRRRESPTPSVVDPTQVREWGSLATIPVLRAPTALAIRPGEPTLRPRTVSSRPERPPRPFA